MIAIEPPGLDQLLAEHCADVAALARHLRDVIVEARPELTERVYSGWHGLGFHHPERGYVAAIFPGTDGVSVGFEHGAGMPDPHGLLRGTGKRLRYLHFTLDDAAPTHEHLIEYLDLAIP
ncbi:DUF1801 domain-containing protein [Dactylosporangium aurantiacum]|uniref:DUF1801 domain-containing protein n=1 Tax=Dactylosporangium aurantiacum TaxID=35754 RepID=A0A9Q9MIB4_9ACTN|nr:DUF1801 domain-containing protein [Dactylosporangium aurantiacum]MDG6104765.1 DUF1801 domain-containing protein [Dactylosporangium aurantiacum]UWZ55675.1 DUF1801 domain-containing protein [Dactylosporangium aurantiacum]